MKSQDVLLKEYEVCQQHLNSIVSHYWILFGVFMPVSTALLGVVPYVIFTLSNSQWLILFLALGVITILACLKLYFNRVNALVSIDYFRMREIETELGMCKNWIVHYLDNWDKKTLDEETRRRIEPLHKGHTGEIGKIVIGITYWVLITLWVLAIILAFVAPCIGILKIAG